MESTTSFADAVGNNVVQSRLLELLTDREDTLRRHEIAEELDVSQASVSRAASRLLGAGLIEEVSDEHELQIKPEAASGITQIQRTIAE